jgi:murein DD-endopeptidase MepM/ murein hydrolase activator NlpD
MTISAAAAAKAIAAALSDERSRQRLGWILAAVLSPVIVLAAAVGGALATAARHNQDTAALAFSNTPIPAAVPAEYRAHIGAMRAAFAELDGAAALLEARMEAGNSLDATRIKAVFFALCFGGDPASADAAAFADCFVRWEERIRTVTVEGENGPYEAEETYTVPVPVTDLGAVCAALAARLGLTAAPEDRANATEIYHRVLYGAAVPAYGPEFDDWLGSLPLSDAPFVGAEGFVSPLGEGWRDMVASEFGFRRDPFTGEQRMHTGIDLAAPAGTPIRAALPATVCFVRYSNTGYGYHLMLDHGGGFATLYAHCSDIFVSEGQAVNAGDVIAAVGSTGRSSGNHLHFEVIAGGEKQNPRGYLP